MHLCYPGSVAWHATYLLTLHYNSRYWPSLLTACEQCVSNHLICQIRVYVRRKSFGKLGFHMVKTICSISPKTWSICKIIMVQWGLGNLPLSPHCSAILELVHIICRGCESVGGLALLQKMSILVVLFYLSFRKVKHTLPYEVWVSENSIIWNKSTK